jgi:hypothetical protein
MRECIEEGILQAYIDAELSPEAAERVAAHIAACADCAETVAEATGEMALFASAFEAENALEVPTIRLRGRLDAAIAGMNQPSEIVELKENESAGGWLASLARLFKVSPQRALGYASLVAVIAFATIFTLIRWNRSVTNGNTHAEIAGIDKRVRKNPVVISSPSSTPEVNKNPNTPQVEKNKNVPSKPVSPRKRATPHLVPEPGQLPQDELAVKALPGEQNYLKAIDSLAVEIEASGATAMKPSLRTEYERNLAIVDQAIDSTRRVARRNPNDPDASQFLYASYQSKLDLLSAVAEQVRPTVASR